MTTKFCSVCGTPKGAAPAAPQWTPPPVQQQPAAPQWNAQPYPQQPVYNAQPTAPQWSAQPVQPLQGFPFPVAETGKRIGAFFMDALMYIVTCGFGYLVWDLIVWKDGQTPGKQILKARVYNATTGRPASWGLMALRQFLIPMIPSAIIWIGLIVGAAYSPYDYYGDYNYSTNYGPMISGIGYLLSFAFYLTDFIMMVNSPLKQGLRDRMAKTVVLDETVRYY
jgi:uncharacterized RDD family membrane protein YckC